MAAGSLLTAQTNGKTSVAAGSAPGASGPLLRMSQQVMLGGHHLSVAAAMPVGWRLAEMKRLFAYLCFHDRWHAY
jgi:hypothetical protein